MLSLLRTLLPLMMFALMFAVELVGPLARKAHAQPPSLPFALPSAAEIEAARSKVPKPAEMAQALKEQQNVIPRVPAAALDASRQPAPDLSQLAAQYERVRRGPGADKTDNSDRQASGLLIFVSLGMPVASLERLLADAERANAMLVLRGVQERSVKKTGQRIRELMGERRVAWQVDPALFTRFEVRAVPSYVLIDPSRPVLVACGQSQCQQASFSKVTGDVNIARALGTIERDDAEFAPLARRYAARLGGVR